VQLVGEWFQIRAQALNGDYPISVKGLTTACQIRKRTPKDGDPALPTDRSGLSKDLSVDEELFPSNPKKEFLVVDGQRGENSWITFDVKCESEGVYRARIEVVLDGKPISKDLYFLVVKK
jgi:hypothetical protein